jgi:hypothetical protein
MSIRTFTASQEPCGHSAASVQAVARRRLNDLRADGVTGARRRRNVWGSADAIRIDHTTA